LVTSQTNLEVKILDTAVTLSNLRDNIKNLKFTVDEAEITVLQSKYEPPTTRRQAELSLDKAIRSYDQNVRSYSLRVEQAKSDIRNIKNNLNEQNERVRDLQDILTKFTVTAPSSGMIIYKRDRMGTKRKVGSTISAWDNVVATLPDMSSMISKTYVNEIDVSKVKPGQRVEMVVDAFPDKRYTGSVLTVANIGEQLPNADAKVFEVLIKVDQSDPILRPSMTTGNKIITKTISDVIYIPLESVQAGADSVPFVYMRNGSKQVVVLGESNENNIVAEQGIEEGQLIYLSTPEDADKFNIEGENLIAVIKERDKLKREEELKMQQQGVTNRPQRGNMMNMTPEQMQQFQNMRGTRGAGDTTMRRRPEGQGGQPGGQPGMQPGGRQNTSAPAQTRIQN
jgi:hypothetical protein